MDSIIIANETVDYIRKERLKGVIVKVDFEKAYNSVEWIFLEYMMNRLGFNSRWIKWINTCLKSTTVSVLVNDNPIKEFRRIRGLRQGDLLAPFLFLIITEGLIGLVRETSRVGILEGIIEGKNGSGSI